MKILMIGDIYGRTGRNVIKKCLKDFVKINNIDFVIANVENATHGKGISRKHYEELKNYGINFMTSGNHIFACEETQTFIKEINDLIRPLNSNVYHPGEGTKIVKVKGKLLKISNILGMNFMNVEASNPYFCIEREIEKDDCDIHIVDFHGEATAEKIAFALYYDGKINAVFGTHTHVQTADERILPKGTAFITDLGMTGPRNGVIGAKPEVVFKRAKYCLSARMSPHEDEGQFNGVVVTFDKFNNKACSIERINKIF
jgi:metallophosphoesterase (TIGR00282 family)